MQHSSTTFCLPPSLEPSFHAATLRHMTSILQWRQPPSATSCAEAPWLLLSSACRVLSAQVRFRVQEDSGLFSSACIVEGSRLYHPGFEVEGRCYAEYVTSSRLVHTPPASVEPTPPSRRKSPPRHSCHHPPQHCRLPNPFPPKIYGAK